MAGDGGRGDLFCHPAAQPRAGDAISEPQLDSRASFTGVAQSPAPALIDPGHRGPSELAWGVPLHDLDQAADFRRADSQEDPVARTDARRLLAYDLPARHAGHEA